VTQGWLAVSFFLAAAIMLLLGYNIRRARTMLVSIAFFALTSAGFTGFSNWLPQVEGYPPPPPPNCEDPKVKAARPDDCSEDWSKMPVEKLSEQGEIIIFGKVGGFAERGIGKGQCPLCHTFKKGDIGDRAPNLIGLGARAPERIKDPRYLKPDTVQVEAYKGSGRATTAEEYIAESHVCPACYVVSGFGTKGTNDRDSPMPQIHKPPIGLTINELIAVDTWLWYREGATPPSGSEIKSAYEKFIPEADRPKPAVTAAVAPGGLDPSKFALPTDTPVEMITKMGCAACHKIPSVDFAKIGAIGPLLMEGTNAPNRIKSPEYKEAMKAGFAHATSPKAYVMESIMDPNAFIVPGFLKLPDPHWPLGKSLMVQDFATKFTYAAVSKLADFLLEQNIEKARAQGLDRNPMEKEGSILKKAEIDGGPASQATRSVSAEPMGRSAAAVVAQR
jgi:hypothetical protein